MSKLLRFHSLISKKAKIQYERLLEQQLHSDVCEKAQRFRDREVKISWTRGKHDSPGISSS